MSQPLTSPDDEHERTELLSVAARACRCAADTRCDVHRLLDDDVAVRRLIFYRRWHLALRRGEWLADPAWRLTV